MLDASSGGTLLSESYEGGYRLIKSITSNKYQCPVTRETSNSTQKRHASVYEVIETTTLAAQVVTGASEVACVYCGGAHLFEECSANPVSVSYIGNNKYNNPYINTYNLGWRNHPNFLWSNNQNQPKP
ncbi:hypothetical protein KIW84_043362 [Lathyrus oleraceus]|uniref:Uncharacterized protein n=1 Tax=Pisum sativum TaxID=3888 RepID=A0A9D4XDM1_PEA|nr:hypothetical protein KIW84_043362 [Pisum sativum]